MSTGFADERTAIESRFAASWTAGAYSSVPVRYENQPWSPPAPTVAFVALWIIRDDEGNQVFLGRPASGRFTGVIQIDICVPEKTGTATALAMADVAAAPFDGTQFRNAASGLITCRKPGVRSLGVIDGRHQHSVRIYYCRDIL